MARRDNPQPPTLHDRYTLAALQGLLAGTLADGTPIKDGDEAAFAKRAFALADAMMAERHERTVKGSH